MGICETVKLPVSELDALKIWPLAKLRISTGAFAITAPVASVMVPVTVAKLVWPKPREAESSNAARIRFMVSPLFAKQRSKLITECNCEKGPPLRRPRLAPHKNHRFKVDKQLGQLVVCQYSQDSCR